MSDRFLAFTQRLGCLFLAFAVLGATPALAALSEEELFFKGTQDVNEGALRFIEAEPEKPLYHFYNQLTISAQSLDDGWIGVAQCHANLDAVPRLQIVYGAGKVRNLEIVSSDAIEEAWVQHTDSASSVQLRNLAPGATVCIRAESNVLKRNGDGFLVYNGPFMRRFLDGYYPMRASLSVSFDPTLIRFSGSEPGPQPGFGVWQKTGEIGYEAHFEGRLETRLYFERQP